MSRALTDHTAASFREDAPRPPVPGEEGEAPCYPAKFSMMRPQGTKSLPLDSPGSSARRNEDGLGEPEGSASPDSPLSRWTKSLHSLLGDQDGAHLFRTFLEREKCVDTLDFWFACNGFRQMDLKDTKTQRVAKAIYKRYIENSCIVAQLLKPATKTFIRDNIKKQMIDSAMFDQAQTEIQATMEENAYQMFLTSDVYLDYVRTGAENPSHAEHSGLGSLKLGSLKLGSLKLVCGYLPTLNEEEEWSCNHLKGKAPASRVGLSAQALRATVALRTVEVMEKGYRSYRRGDSGKAYHVGSYAPATSTNESEASSDAMTDDSMSMTDSSVVKQRCLLEQKRRKQRATKKICIFIGSYVICYAPYVITRLTELLPNVCIDRRWGIATKCLSYGKGACDPFVYSLLRQQYRKALVNVTHRVLRWDQYRSPGQSTSSTFDMDYDGNIPQPRQLRCVKV